jgi:ABC-2 type transport system ATP-binding protein
MAVIELRDVTRRFGALTAVDAVSLDVAQGEIVGLLGHNGAGKTTLLRVINGLLPPDAGTVRAHGLDPTRDGERVRQRTGVLTEYPALEAFLSVRENLEIYAAIHDVPRARATERIDGLLGRLGLAGKQDQPTRDLSAGLKQRVALARALVHDPELLLLDEPTTNMDPVAAREVRRLVLQAAREDGKTVLLSTHNLVEAEELCDRVAILREGRLLMEGPPGELRRTLGAASGAVLRTLPERATDLRSALAPRWNATVRGEDTVGVQAVDPYQGNGQGGPLDIAALVRTAVGADIPVLGVVPQEPTLEDLYIALHADSASEPARMEAT